MFNQNKKIALVLHQICDSRESIKYFEDVEYDIFKNIVSLIKELEYKNKITLTFDDGYISDYEIVFRDLLKNNILGSFFIVPKYIGKKNYLTWPMVREMSEHGMNIGSHSLSHKDLTKINADELNIEINDSKKIIEDNIGKNINDFSFPFGKKDINSLNTVIRSGYENIYISQHGLINEDNIIKPRNSINSKTSYKSLRSILDPNILKQFKWKIEDFSKNLIKGTLGIEKYKFIRSILL